MKEQKVNLKLVLTEGYEKRFTEAVCKVWTNRNKQLVPPEDTSFLGISKKKQQDKEAV